MFSALVCIVRPARQTSPLSIGTEASSEPINGWNRIGVSPVAELQPPKENVPDSRGTPLFGKRLKREIDLLLVSFDLGEVRVEGRRPSDSV
jgi:hypothetical protein